MSNSTSFIANVNLLSENLPTLLEFTTEESIENFVTVRVDHHLDEDNVGDTIYSGIQRAIASLDIQGIDDVDNDGVTTIVDVFSFSIGKRIDDGLNGSSSDIFTPAVSDYFNTTKESGNSIAYELVEQLASSTGSPLYIILDNKVDNYFIENSSSINTIVIEGISSKVNSSDFVSLLNTTFTTQLNTTGSEILNVISSKVSDYFSNNISTVEGKITTAIVSKINGSEFVTFMETQLTKDDNALLREESYKVASDNISVEILEDETYNASVALLSADDNKILVDTTREEVEKVVVDIVETEATTQVTPIVVGITTNEAQSQVESIVDLKVETEAKSQISIIAPDKVATKVENYDLQPDVISTVDNRLTDMDFETVVENKVDEDYEKALEVVVENIVSTDAFEVAVINAKVDIDNIADTRIEDINEVIDTANSTINSLYASDLLVQKTTWEAKMALMQTLTRQSYNQADMQANRMEMLAIPIQETNENLAIITAEAEAARDAALNAANVSSDMLGNVKASISTSSFAFLSQDFYGGQQ